MGRHLSGGRSTRKSGIVLCMALALTVLLSVAVQAAQREIVAVLYGSEIQARLAWAIEEFQAQNPDIKVEVMMVQGGTTDELKENILVRMAGGVKMDVIPLFMGYFDEFVALDVVQPLDAFIARDRQDFDDIIPGVAALFESEGSHYALPSEYAGKAVVYNKSYFQQIGLADPNMDWTWTDLAEMARVARRVNSEGEIEMGGFGHHFADRYWHHDPLAIILWAFGADYFNEDTTELMLHTPQAREALQFIVDNWQDRGVFTPQSGFFAGRLAMSNVGSWELTQVNETPFDVGIVPYPHGPAGAYNFPGYWGYAISSDAGDLEASWRFLQFLSNDYVMQQVRERSGMPVRKSHLASSEWLDGLFPWESTEVWNYSLQTARSFNYGFYGNDVINMIGPEWIKALNGEIGVDFLIDSVKPVADEMLQR